MITNPDELLEKEHESILHNLDSLINNYHFMTRDQIFVSASTLTGEISEHIEHQEPHRTSRIDRSSYLKYLLDQHDQNRERIAEVIEVLQMEPVDQPDFYQDICYLLRLFEAHSQLAGDWSEALAKTSRMEADKPARRELLPES